MGRELHFAEAAGLAIFAILPYVAPESTSKGSVRQSFLHRGASLRISVQKIISVVNTISVLITYDLGPFAE
jgi:hypothetical protein